MAHFIKPHLSLTPDPNAHALTGFSIVTPPSHVTHSGVPELVLGRRPRDRGSPDPTEPNWAPLTLAPRPKRLSLVRESQLGASLCPCPSDEEGPTSGPRTVMSREVRTRVENNWWLSRPMNKLHFFFFFLEQRPKGIQQTAQGDTRANEGGGKGNGGAAMAQGAPRALAAAARGRLPSTSRSASPRESRNPGLHVKCPDFKKRFHSGL